MTLIYFLWFLYMCFLNFEVGFTKMKSLPEGFSKHVEKTIKDVQHIEGHLTLKEIRFLCLLAAVPTTSGEILEIGSFKGKSTVVLAKSLKLINNNNCVIAVDPMTLPASTDPTTDSTSSLYSEFKKNLRDHNVDSVVEFYQMFSQDLSLGWNRKLRFLWIDGDHTYSGAKRDFEIFSPFLNPGAIVALHDVLHGFEGPIRVMTEHVLLSDKFGACGICGSIGWAQYLGNSQETKIYWKYKLQLYKKLIRLIPYVALHRKVKGLERHIYRLKRGLVPHGEVNPQSWIENVKFSFLS